MGEREPPADETRSITAEPAIGQIADRARSPDKPPGPLALSPGDCVGRYTIRECIGRGSMGEVFAASDPELDRVVALKVLRADRGASPAARARFVREVQAMARLNHPNVVSVHDVDTIGARVFVTMELVEGPSLADWMAAGPHPSGEVIDIFLQAGRGLLAAHQAGIVHRDFKPDNVILGDRVRVADFGLARPTSDREASVAAVGPMLDGTVTHSGQVVGTPAYMAPEQRAGAPPTPLGDQYSFCVALHEALVGSRPGSAAPPASLPRRLRVILARGLAPRPEDRFPSMAALLSALAHDPRRARRRLLVGAGAALVVLAALAAPALLGTEPCSDAGSLPPVWDDAARMAVARALRATGRSYADATFARVDAALRERVDRWVAGSKAACQATYVRREQSEALFDLRTRCLARARAELDALVAVLRRADVEALDRATQAIAERGDVEACADIDRLAGDQPPPPSDTGLAALYRELAHLIALRELAQWTEAVPLARDLSGRARRAGYLPLVAVMLNEAGAIEVEAGDVDAGLELLSEATRVGATVRDDATVARAFNEIQYALGARKHRFEAADVAYLSAVAAAERAGNPPRILAQLYMSRADVVARNGDDSLGLALRVLALALYERLYGPESYRVATMLGVIGISIAHLGHAPRAWAIEDRAVAIAATALGPWHPRVAGVVGNAAAVHVESGDLEGGAALLERALAIAERSLPPGHPTFALHADNLGNVRLAQRRLADARASYERAARLRETREGRDHPRTAHSLSGVAEVLRLEGEPDQAHRLLGEVIAAYRKAYAAGHPWLVEALVSDAGVLLDLGRLPEARAAADAAVALGEKVLGRTHPDYGNALAALGDVLCGERRCGEASPLFRRALALQESELGVDSPCLVEPLVGLCGALVATGEVAAARPLAERALRLAATAPGDIQARARFCAAQTAGDAARARVARDALASGPHRRCDVARMDDWLARAARR